jgi:hypothetical protein
MTERLYYLLTATKDGGRCALSDRDFYDGSGNDHYILPYRSGRAAPHSVPLKAYGAEKFPDMPDDSTFPVHHALCSSGPEMKKVAITNCPDWTYPGSDSGKNYQAGTERAEGRFGTVPRRP